MSDQTPLFNYLRETKGLLCLACPLPECRESDRQCLYSQSRRRLDYFKTRYAENADELKQKALDRFYDKREEILNGEKKERADRRERRARMKGQAEV